MTRNLEEEIGFEEVEDVDFTGELVRLAEESSSNIDLTMGGCVTCNSGGPACVSCVCVSTGPGKSSVYDTTGVYESNEKPKYS